MHFYFEFISVFHLTETTKIERGGWVTGNYGETSGKFCLICLILWSNVEPFLKHIGTPWNNINTAWVRIQNARGTVIDKDHSVDVFAETSILQFRKNKFTEMINYFKSTLKVNIFSPTLVLPPNWFFWSKFLKQTRKRNHPIKEPRRKSRQFSSACCDYQW